MLLRAYGHMRRGHPFAQKQIGIEGSLMPIAISRFPKSSHVQVLIKQVGMMRSCGPLMGANTNVQVETEDYLSKRGAMALAKRLEQSIGTPAAILPLALAGAHRRAFRQGWHL
jgi:hypothetical protein